MANSKVRRTTIWCVFVVGVTAISYPVSFSTPEELPLSCYLTTVDNELQKVIRKPVGVKQHTIVFAEQEAAVRLWKQYRSAVANGERIPPSETLNTHLPVTSALVFEFPSKDHSAVVHLVDRVFLLEKEKTYNSSDLMSEILELLADPSDFSVLNPGEVQEILGNKVPKLPQFPYHDVSKIRWWDPFIRWITFQN